MKKNKLKNKGNDKNKTKTFKININLKILFFLFLYDSFFFFFLNNTLISYFSFLKYHLKEIFYCVKINRSYFLTNNLCCMEV